MKKTITAKKSSIFTKTIHRGKSYSDKLLVVYIFKNKSNINRIGISVGKKVGNAIKRNRIKRLIKEAYRSIENFTSTGYDIIYIPRKFSSSEEIKTGDIYNSMKKIFKKLDIYNEEVMN